MVCFTDIDNILLVSYTCNIMLCNWCTTVGTQVMHNHGNWNVGTIFLTLPLVVTAQEVENFSCDFSGCIGEDMFCYCSVPGGPLYWWDGNSCITLVNNSGQTRDEANVVAEVVAVSPSGGFTSRLTRSNISTELNGTEIGCFRTNCSPSSTSRNSSFTLLVQTCRGKTL